MHQNELLEKVRAEREAREKVRQLEDELKEANKKPKRGSRDQTAAREEASKNIAGERAAIANDLEVARLQLELKEQEA